MEHDAQLAMLSIYPLIGLDAVPAPPVVVRLARGMGRPVRELMTAAGFAPGDDPLLDETATIDWKTGERYGNEQEMAVSNPTPQRLYLMPLSTTVDPASHRSDAIHVEWVLSGPNQREPEHPD